VAVASRELKEEEERVKGASLSSWVEEEEEEEWRKRAQKNKWLFVGPRESWLITRRDCLFGGS